MSQPQQQEKPEDVPEYHTIQVFREADMILEQQQHQPAPKCACCLSAMNAPTMCVACSPDSRKENMPTTTTEATSLDLIPYDQSEDGIGGDWAMDVEMDATEAEDVPCAERRGSESTLYSFYFETPITTQQQQEQQDDDFTITSQETESFHNTEDLSLLQDSSSFWETGLATADAPAMQRCISPAHVSLTGETPKQQPVSRMC